MMLGLGGSISCLPFFINRNMKDIKLIIDRQALDRYNEFYFSVHTKAHKEPLPYPYHESINKWMIMKRPMMNALKQKWKDFMVWFLQDQGYANLHINKCEMIFSTYYSTNRRHDVDNSVPKFILDGFTEGGFIDDDDNKHITKLTLECFTDENNPRTEILIKEIKEN